MSKETEQLIKGAAEALGTEPEQLTAVITKFQKEIGELEAEAAALERHIK